MISTNPTDARSRLRERATAWRVVIGDVLETETSVIAFGRRDDQAVTLKVARQPGDEWRSGVVLQAFDGRGTVRILDYVDGAFLLERLTPGSSLLTTAGSDRDDAATEILSDVIGRMSPGECGDVPTVEDWGRSFERYRLSDDQPLPAALVDQAHRIYTELCGSQRGRRLLHGDLHHGNVLLDARRGWLAIDPKGVAGEPEYEIGAALRNPIEKPDLFLQPQIIQARVQCFAQRLHLDADRILGWAFAQAVLSVIWLIEDGASVGDDHPWLELARTIRRSFS